MATINSCEDDREPPCVSQMLHSILHYLGLSFLEQSLKRDFAVCTYRGFAYLCDGLFYSLCEGQVVGTVSRLVELRMHALRDVAVVDEMLPQEKDCTDAEPELISRKLAAKLKQRGLECLSGVLVSCDIVRYEWLGMLSCHDIQIVCGCVYAQGLDYDGERVGRFIALCGEAAIEWRRRLRGGDGYGVPSCLFQTVALARGTEPPSLVVAQGSDEGLQTFTGRTQAFGGSRRAAGRRGDGGYGAPSGLLQNVAASHGTGPPPLGAVQGGDEMNGAGDQAPQTFHWQRFLLSSLAKLELERALMWSKHPKLKWADTSATLERASRDLCCQARDLVEAPRQRRDLRGALRAFSITCELVKAAKRAGWSTSGCASAIRSTAPTLRDVAMWRACDLVGIRDREAYLIALNNCSNGEIGRNPNFQSQMLMAFESSMGFLLGAFASNSSKDARRRGKARPRRQRGGDAVVGVDAAGIEGFLEDLLDGEDEEDYDEVHGEPPIGGDDDPNCALICPCFNCNGQEPDAWGVDCLHLCSSCSATDELPASAVETYEEYRPIVLLKFRQLWAQADFASRQRMDTLAGEAARVRRDELNNDLECAIIVMLDAGVPQNFVRILADDDSVAFSDDQKSSFFNHVGTATLEHFKRCRLAAAPAAVLVKRMEEAVSYLSYPGPRCAGEAWMDDPRLQPMVGAASSFAASSSSASMGPFQRG